MSACSRSLLSDLLSDGLGASLGTWSCDGSRDGLDLIWSYDLPMVTWSGTSEVPTPVCDSEHVLMHAYFCRCDLCYVHDRY
jgi:hypothetical protein